MFEQRQAVRIVIADDDAGVRGDLRVLLELTGSVQVVGDSADGKAAIRLARELHPDTVVLDLEMPVLDGFAAARQIKAKTPACRIVALTVHGDEVSRARAAAAGFDAFVVKGASLPEMLGAIVGASRALPYPSHNPA